MLYIRNWHGEYDCDCRVAMAMVDLLEKFRGRSMSKIAYINFILANHWIWEDELYFEESSLIDNSAANPCVHELEGVTW